MEILKRISFPLAVIGMLVTIAGNFFDISVTKKVCYLVGAVFLFVPALIDKDKVFTLLEAILIVGASIAFLHLSFFWKSVLPISLGAIAAIYLIISGEIKDRLMWLSAFGLLIGTWGYAVTNPILYFIAGSVLAIYAFCRGNKLSIVFGSLNSVFAVTALLEIVGVMH